MKTILRVSALLASAPLFAAPVLHIDSRTFTPSTTFKLAFDHPVVAPEQIGKSMPNTLLTIEPALEGTITWTEPSVAVFERTGVPALGTTFTFSLSEGLAHLDGSAIPAGKLRTLTSSPFVLEYGYRRGSLREPSYVLHFNDDIDPASAAPHLVFADKSGRKITAKVRHAVVGDLVAQRSLRPTWAQRFQNWTPPDPESLDPNTVLPAAIVVTPERPLLIGDGWHLTTQRGLPNAAKTTALRTKSNRWVGTIRPFEVLGIRAVTQLNGPRFISIALSTSLPQNLTPEELAPFIAIDPQPENYKIEAQGSRIALHGDFGGSASWNVRVHAGLPAADGLVTTKPGHERLEFHHLSPSLTAPSFTASQLAIGNRSYAIQTTNLANAHVRIKRLAGQDAVRTYQGYRHYSGDGPANERIKRTHSIPWSLVAGETIYDQKLELDNGYDTTRAINLNWSEILKQEQGSALLFISVEGDPKEGLKDTRKRAVQIFLQLSDIGLAWKLTEDTAFIYAYSCHTGQPLADVQLDVFGEDAATLHSARTDANGAARLPRTAAQRQLRASIGSDAVIMNFEQRMPTVSMWQFSIRTRSNPVLASHRTAMLFTDRSLYRPGEEVHLKGIVRRIDDNRSVFDSSKSAQLVIRDPARRVLVERDISFSEQGSFHTSFPLPAETVGQFRFELRWPDEITGADKIDDWRKRAAVLNSARFFHSINVQEFRRNAFEVTSEFADAESPDRNHVKLNLTAKYYQGQPVADAKVEWYSQFTPTGFYPAGYRDFLFGDHRTYDPHYWAHYFGYEERGYYRRQNESNEHGSATLDQDGFASIEFKLKEVDFPAPRKISVTSEIRDQRNQTLSAQSATTVHSSNLYLGVSRVDRLARVGNQFDWKVIAVTSGGDASTQPVAATLKIEREVHQQIKTKNQNGSIAVRNEKHTEVLEERSLTIEPAHNTSGGLIIPFKPAQSGKYVLTFSGTDRDGREFRTAVSQYVYGSDQYSWAYEEGMRIKLVPEKKRYLPGETARILVLSPIEGTALVTVEREGVIRHTTVDLTSANPVVEIPVTDDDAPNAFVSVLVIKGSQDNQRKQKEPILRLGYCELTVANTRERIQVAMKIPGEYHRPGEEVVINGLVRDFQGNPLEGAEVTLYAEDEGTLAVAGYRNPDPIAHFYTPRPLRVKAGTSLGMILSEDPADRHLFNKGVFIGGGGGEFDNPGRLRKDFNPCAVWAPALVCDSEGRFQVNFDSPDTLTRYRVIAVAQHGAAHFGSETTEFVVNKPLMLEPSVPRFAHEGDRLQPKVLVQNATSYTGTWEVSLQIGSLTRFVEGSDQPTQSKTITIPADSSATVSFDLTFHDTGTVDWKWSAKPLSVDGIALDPELGKRLSDAVATTFDVEYPMPLLRETHFISFQEPSAQQDMLKGLSEKLLEGRGSLEFEFGRSVLLEAGGALDFLLKYPYGCVEQTTSSTIPWVAALNLRDVAPAFQNKTKEEILRNIQAGANRLLSMQCADGGLAYWPGRGKSTDWASAYGGMAILLCKEAGAEIPESAVAGLRKYLAAHLRGIANEDDWWKLENAARSCYTLALAGDPQVPYHNKLIENAEQLSPNSLSFLALAVAKSGVDNANETAAKLLGVEGTIPERKGHFLRRHPGDSYRLLALTVIQPDSSECVTAIDRILQQRSRAGHWGTTWANAWTVYALGEYAQKVETQSAPPVIRLTTDEGEREITLDSEHPSESVRIPLHGGLKASASATRGAFARVKLAAKPKISPRQAVSKDGLQILRSYFRVKPDGSSEILQQPAVGDLIKVELQITMPRNGTRYLVVDDPLPSIFETVNTDFASQAGRVEKENTWRVSHQELRDDRAVFFLDYVPSQGTYKLSYHARVTSAGEAVAPPAKVEAMYEPEFFALSNSRSFKTPNPLHTAAR